MESCPSRSKEHDWKSCKRPKPFRGFESLALRQKRSNFCLPKVTSFFIQAAGLVYHHRAKRGAYHQPSGLYLIKSQEYAPSVMIYAYGDDIHAKAWWYTKPAAWIKKEVTFGRQKLLLFWRRVRDSNPRFLSESLVFKTSSLNRSDNSPCGVDDTIICP